MNKQELHEWFQYHNDLFPAFLEWWKVHGNDALRSVWQEQLASVELLDCKAASSAMLSGDFDAKHPEKWNYNALPRYICGVIRTINNSRLEAERKHAQEEELYEQRRRRHYYSQATEKLADQIFGREALIEAEKKKRQQPAYREHVREAVMKVVRGKKEDCNSRINEECNYIKRYRWALTEEDLKEVRLYDSCKLKAIG